MSVTNVMVGWVLMGVAGFVLVLGTIRDLLPRARAGRLTSLAMRISIHHAICRGHLVDVFFTEAPTLKDVAARGAAMLAHDFPKVRGTVHAEWASGVRRLRRHASV
jgi:hypothetical protein